MTRARRAIRGLVAIAVALTIAAAAPHAAHAQEAGGTRSIFSSGAGARALSLGGAFTAVPNDASALLWNPGALGYVERMEIEAAHAAYGELGFRQEYASLVLPSWRWGVAGITFQSFGVGGIEARDDRNQLIDSDLTDSETEITVGFGRALSEAVSVGGAVKVQRQHIAGWSGSGLGADVGLLVRPGLVLRSESVWSDRLTLGLSIRNLVEPRLRLDQESVSDPATTRVGIAYRQPAPGGSTILAAIDLERSAGIGARLHTGMEVRLHPALALRSGLNDGKFAAGAGVSWRDFSLDYTFEDRDEAPVHRVGISRAFGMPVNERREAAATKAEQAVLARMEEAFRIRQEAQIGDLLTRAESAHASGSLEEALDILGTVSTLDPGNIKAAALHELVLREQSMRQEAAGKLRKQQDEEALARRVPSIQPTSPPAPAMVVPPKKPAAPADSTRQVKAKAPSKPPISKQTEREVEALYKRGLQAMSERRAEEALRYWELVWSLHPGYQNVDDLLKREYLTRGMEYFASGRLEEAMSYWERALRIDPTDERAKGYLARARTQMERTRELMGETR